MDLMFALIIGGTAIGAFGALTSRLSRYADAKQKVEREALVGPRSVTLVYIGGHPDLPGMQLTAHVGRDDNALVIALRQGARARIPLDTIGAISSNQREQRTAMKI